MLKFLKEKLKGAISKISEGVEKEGKVEEKIVEKPAEDSNKEEKGFFAKLKEKFVKSEEKEKVKEAEEPKEEESKEEPLEIKKAKAEPASEPEEEKEIEVEAAKPKAAEKSERKEPEKQEKGHKPNHRHKEFHSEKEEPQPIRNEEKPSKHLEEKHAHAEKAVHAKETFETEEAKKQEPKAELPKKEHKEEKKGFFESLKERIITTKINEEQFNKLFWELELALLENNVAVEAIEKIKSDLKEALVEKPIKRGSIEETIETALKDSIKGLFVNSDFNLLEEIRKKQEKPYVIVFFGINGSGKTTSIAKVAKMLKDSKLNCVLAAADTFRAASIEQLELHGNKIGIKVIKHDYGSDPAAVAFDAIKHAKSKNADVVLIDTAGRMHSNKNLMREMEKVVRVAKPDLRIFVGESITGNDAVEQAKAFNDSLGIDGIILSKLDVDEKGGAAVSVSYVTQKPILYFGNGQEYKDLKKFEAEVVVKGLGLG